MKKITLIFVSIFLLTSHLYSQYEWSELIYHYQTGSIPPPYFYSYELRIASTGSGTLLYYPDYSEDTVWTFAINITEDDLKVLNSSILESNILGGQIPSVPDSQKPIGGPLENLTVILYQDPNLDQLPQQITTPYFPEKEYTEKLEKLSDLMKRFIPETTWKEIDYQREPNINQSK
jgi:hypothetical protein